MAIWRKTRLESPVGPPFKAEETPDGKDDASTNEKEGEAEDAGWPTISPLRSVILTINLTLTMTLNVLSAQAIVVCLPSMSTDLNIAPSDQQWLISAYSLAFGCFLLLFGRLSDLYGHKYVFLAGVTWYAIWCIACALAKDVVSICLFRAFQGMGAAASVPSAMGILAHVFPPGPSRSTAFASFSAGAALGGSLGNVFGGVLTTYAPIGYRAVFYVCAGLGGLIFVLAIVVVPQDYKKDRKGDRSVDWFGAFIVTSGLVLLTFALADAKRASKGWNTPYIPATFSLSILLLVAFYFWEQHVEYRTARMPLLRFSLFKRPYFTMVQLIAALGWSCFASQQFFTTLFYQDYLYLTPILATIRYLPMSITGLCLNFLVAVVASRASAQLLILLGLIGTSLSSLLFILRTQTELGGVVVSYWHYEFPAMILTVFGADLIFACGILAGAKVAGRDEQALAGGIFNTVTQIGSSIGLAISTQVQQKVTSSQTAKLGGIYNASIPSSVPPEALLKGLHAAFWSCFAFGCAAALLALIFLRGIGTVGQKKTSQALPPAVAASDERVKSDAGAMDEIMVIASRSA